MGGTIAELALRPRQKDDDAFLDTLSARVFAAYSTNPRVVTRSIVDEEGAETVIAEMGRTRVGFVVVRFEALARDFGPWTKPVLGRIDAIAVRPDAQGRGIGRALLDRVEEMAHARSARSLSLMTAETNLRARRLFEAQGFRRFFRIERAYINEQRAVAMIKSLPYRD